MNETSKALSAAISAVALGILCSQQSAQAADKVEKKDESKEVHCFGLNVAKGANSCGVGTDEIKIANEVYKNKYAKSQPFDCAGNATKGSLAWVTKPSKEDCFKKGGFLISSEGGKYQIEDKTGIKTSKGG